MASHKLNLTKNRHLERFKEMPIGGKIVIGGIVAAGAVISVAFVFDAIWPTKQPVAIVVLGKSDKQDAMERVDTAAFIAGKYNNRKHSLRVIMTGEGAGINGLSEAEWMAQYWNTLDTGIQVEIEPFANSTVGNVKNVAAMLKGMEGEKVIVVSNHPHVLSAAWCFRWAHGFDSFSVQAPSVDILPAQSFSRSDLCSRAGCCSQVGM